MRHRTLGCVGAAVLGLALLWPPAADAQNRRGTPAAGRGAPAGRSVAVRRPPVYSRGPYYSRPTYPRYYYPGYYSRYGYGYPLYGSSFSLYWGWGYPWYPYYGGWGWGYPHWYGPGPWYGYYYDDHASVRVQGAPREARVYVDGYFVGLVDDFDGTFQRLRLPPGAYEITLHLKGFRNVREKLYLQPHGSYRMRTQLEQLPAGAPPDPEPVPNPDAVRARESRREYGPEEPEPQGPPSSRWPARQQAEAQQPPRPQSEPPLPARDSRFGTLVVRVQPPDAVVVVDDTPWRYGADESGAISIQIPAGSHRIEVRRDGYASFVTELDVRAGASTPLNVMLQKD